MSSWNMKEEDGFGDYFDSRSFDEYWALNDDNDDNDGSSNDDSTNVPNDVECARQQKQSHRPTHHHQQQQGEIPEGSLHDFYGAGESSSKHGVNANNRFSAKMTEKPEATNITSNNLFFDAESSFNNGGRLKSLDEAYLEDSAFLDALEAEYADLNDSSDGDHIDIQQQRQGQQHGHIPLNSSGHSGLGHGTSYHSYNSSSGTSLSIDLLEDGFGSSSHHNQKDVSADGEDGRVYDSQHPHHQKTIRFAPQIATPMGEDSASTSHHMMMMMKSETSLQSLDVFDTGQLGLGGGSHHTDGSGSSGNHNSGLSSYNDEDEDDNSFVSAVSEEDDPDKKIKRQMLFALGGVGLFALVGYGFKKIMNAFSKDDTDLDAGADFAHNAVDVADAAANANDVAGIAIGGDGGASSTAAASTTLATEATNGAATFHASASASQSQIGFGGGFGMAGNTTSGLSPAQTQVLQQMAVSAANNAASSAASASTTLASAATAAAGAGAAVASAATISTIATVVSTCKSHHCENSIGFVVSHLNLPHSFPLFVDPIDCSWCGGNCCCLQYRTEQHT